LTGARHGPAADPEHPWTDSRFWLLQLAILALSLVRLAAVVGSHVAVTDPAVELTTVAIFLVPVIYASLNYGFSGGVFTGLWVTLLEVPRFVGYIDAHSPTGASVELLQVMALLVTALLIGHRISADRLARTVAEASDLAQRSAEALYRDLFDSNTSPILIVDAGGTVVEANASARQAFPASGRRTVDGTSDRARLVDVIGPVAAGHVLPDLVTSPTVSTEVGDDGPGVRPEPVAFQIDGELVLYRPTVTALHGTSGHRGLQIVFQDVTAEIQRHDRMEAYAGQVLLGQEEERRHIAQDLHDGPVQVLIHLCRQIDALPSELGLDAAQTASLSDLRDIAEGAVTELRTIAKGLRPPILDDLGLVASIGQLLTDAGHRLGIETSIGVAGQARRLPTHVELAVFRISQEALSNIERHAQAKRIAVGLDFEGGGVRLLIRDDGVGFDPSGGDHLRRGSLGLPGMTERAHLAGGTLRIHSGLATGTTVDLSIPNV
jgi:signal transduction histidine kinase